MSNGFQFFEGTTSENTTPRVTVRKGGQMVLTGGTVELLGDGVSHVQLGYNPKTAVVGIRAADKDTKGGYRLRAQGSNGLHLVTGKRFFSHHGLETDKARSFTAEKIEDGLVGFCLKNEPAAAKDEGKKTRRPAAEAA